MKGILFNLAEEVVSQTYGERVWDDVLESAGLDGAYTSLGNYPDEDLARLVKAAARALDVDVEDVLRAVATGAIPLLASRYPHFFTPHTSARSFVLTLNSIIHPEVRKLYPGATVPEFGFDTTRDDVLVITYHSARRLCSLAQGFIIGAAGHYGETVEITEPTCMHRGDAACDLHCRFERIPE